MFRLTNENKGYGGGGGIPGFSNTRMRKSTVNDGNFDGDKKPNRTDCDPLDFKKQDGGEAFTARKIEREMRVKEDQKDADMNITDIFGVRR